VEYVLNVLAVSLAVLQVGTVILLLLRGPVRKYAFVLAYCSLQVGTSLVEMLIERKFGRTGKLYAAAFWTDEIALDLLLFFILILLTYRAMEGSPAQKQMGRMLGAVTLIVMVLPFVLYKGAPNVLDLGSMTAVKTAWFDHTSQLLNFGAAILNLGLWGALVASRRKDTQLLTVSAGFGIVATGVAISFGMRRLIVAHGAAVRGGALWESANLVFILAHLAGAAILCWAFRPVRVKGADVA
jgi:hypothetical protein